MMSVISIIACGRLPRSRAPEVSTGSLDEICR